MNIQEVIKELKLFSPTIIHLPPPVKPEDVILFESKFSLHLPNEYKEFLKHHNGLTLMSNTIYGINYPDKYSLAECYFFEHFEVGNQMPRHLIPFSPDGAGNHYCFDIREHSGSKYSPIVFWQHDYLYSELDPPEIVNENLIDWIREVIIEWTLEDFDYDGNEKG